jgi:gluconate 2-dehydrogenase gamma chain
VAQEDADVNPDNLSRRALLQALAATLGAAGATELTAILQAAEAAHADARSQGDARLAFFNAVEAADVEAVAAQIVPTDDTPGAREAGVVHFIDRALATFLARLSADYRAQLRAFQGAFREKHPDVATFAALGPDQQVTFLQTVDRTKFFETTRLLTILGMFSMPAYGGNRNALGWELIGFRDEHAFQPPFGHYDREYPGFVADWTRTP